MLPAGFGKRRALDGAFLDRARRDGFGACVLLLPGVDGPWAAQVQAGLANAPLRLQAVFALDGWAPEAPAPWRRVFLQPSGPGGAAPGEVLVRMKAATVNRVDL